MFLHITFKDGSNPYVKYNIKDLKELNNLTKRWEKNYTICGYWTACGFMATATEKEE